MKKGLLLGSLITVCGFFPMQASALQSCKITLRVDSYYNMNSGTKMAFLANYATVGAVDIKAGDIVKDIEIALPWSHKKPSNVTLQLDHVQYYGGIPVDTGNQLWTADVRSTWEGNGNGSAIKTEVIKKGIVSLSGLGPLTSRDATTLSRINLAVFYRFNGLNNVIEVPRSWCNETAMHYAYIYVPEHVLTAPEYVYLNALRAKKPGDPVSEWEHLPPVMLFNTYHGIPPRPLRVPYDIVKEIGMDVPPVVDFGRVDTGVVAKQDIDVRLTYVGIPGRGLLTFSYAGAQNMEVTVKEKSESQDTPLPYYKYIEQLPQDTMSLSYQIGVKGHIAKDTEQLVLVTFHVF
ncbi:hypothetical protein MUZ47_004384 [Salmonella enterica]|nr:hypothetical protein [Salmonella enterica]